MLKNTFAFFRTRTKLLVMTTIVMTFAAFEMGVPVMDQNAFAGRTMPSKPFIDQQHPGEIATATFAMG
jgi:hypothetical protein